MKHDLYITYELYRDYFDCTIKNGAGTELDDDTKLKLKVVGAGHDFDSILIDIYEYRMGNYNRIKTDLSRLEQLKELEDATDDKICPENNDYLYNTIKGCDWVEMSETWLCTELPVDCWNELCELAKGAD